MKLAMLLLHVGNLMADVDDLPVAIGKRDGRCCQDRHRAERRDQHETPQQSTHRCPLSPHRR
jgi:hypothetical protein